MRENDAEIAKITGWGRGTKISWAQMEFRWRTLSL